MTFCKLSSKNFWLCKLKVAHVDYKFDISSRLNKSEKNKIMSNDQLFRLSSIEININVCFIFWAQNFHKNIMPWNKNLLWSPKEAFCKSVLAMQSDRAAITLLVINLGNSVTDWRFLNVLISICRVIRAFHTVTYMIT